MKFSWRVNKSLACVEKKITPVENFTSLYVVFTTIYILILIYAIISGYLPIISSKMRNDHKILTLCSLALKLFNREIQDSALICRHQQYNYITLTNSTVTFGISQRACFMIFKLFLICR